MRFILHENYMRVPHDRPHCHSPFRPSTFETHASNSWASKLKPHKTTPYTYIELIFDISYFMYLLLHASANVKFVQNSRAHLHTRRLERKKTPSSWAIWQAARDARKRKKKADKQLSRARQPRWQRALRSRRSRCVRAHCVASYCNAGRAAAHVHEYVPHRSPA